MLPVASLVSGNHVSSDVHAGVEVCVEVHDADSSCYVCDVEGLPCACRCTKRCWRASRQWLSRN